MPTDFPGGVTIRAATTADAEALARIYNHFVTSTVVTFEEETASPTEMVARLDEVYSASLPWLIAESDGVVLGYAHASTWKGRCGYRFSVEVTVYLEPSRTGRGLGTLLYGELLPKLAARGAHAALGGIALPNDASVALHEKLGFQKVAHFKEVGFKFGQWIDVGYWERLF